MPRSRFWFVDDAVDPKHLERAFTLINELLTLSESEQYQANEELVGSFRKTIIILTASIIEILLLLMLRKEKTADDCGETRDSIGDTLYTINSTERIAIVKKKFTPANFTKLNLDQINKLCKRHKLISCDLAKEVDNVRDLRNRQHLGSLSELEASYEKSDLDFVFSVAKRVVDQAEVTLTF